jgi:iron complex outermembrane receptor protein
VLFMCCLTFAARAQEPIEVRVQDERSGPPTAAREPGVASSVIQGEALHAAGADTQDVLARAPGVQVTRTGASADLATASLRGASSAQLPVYLAGVRLNDDVTGTADLSSVPLFMLDRIEVYRGNAPWQAERLGLGGAIFLEPRLPQRTRVGAGAGAGSFGELSFWTAAETARHDAGAMVALRRSHADDDYAFVDDRGTVSVADDVEIRRPNADWTSYDLWAIARAPLGAPGARVTTIVNAFSREQGVSRAVIDPDSSARARTDRLLFAVSARAPCASGCALELTSSALASRSVLTDPQGDLVLGAPFVASDGARFVQRAHVEQALAEPDVESDVLPARIGVGASAESERLSLAEPNIERAASRRGGRLDVAGGLPLGRSAELLAFAALGCQTTDGPESEGETCAVLEPEGRLGARVVLARRRRGAALDAEVLGNVNRYVRIPTLGELYGVSALVRGNDELAPEQGVGADLGARIATRGGVVKEAWLDGFVFARRAADLIAFRRSSFRIVRPFNVGEARILGAELSTGADALRHARLGASLTLLDPRDVTAGGPANDLLPYMSRLVASEELELYDEPDGVIYRSSVLARLSHRSSRATDPAGLIIIAEEHVLDIEAAVSFFDERLAVHFGVENVLGSPRFDVVGLPLPERSVHVAVEAWLW